MPDTQLFQDGNKNAVQALRPGEAQSVSYSGTSVQTSALPADARIVRVVTTTGAYISIGENPTATAQSTYMPPSIPEYFVLDGPSQKKVAVIQAAAAGTLNVTVMR
jgi:hypothetical protein